MPASAISSLNAASSLQQQEQLQSSFRQTDFLSIMLSEITHQDPFKPTETSKMVENMKMLQELANVQYQKFRDDIGWAQDLVGQTVTVQQVNVKPDEAMNLVERGITPDLGYGTVEGEVETYRTVGETVWVTIGGKDYPVDNVQRITPRGTDPATLAGVADSLLGRRATYLKDDGTTGTGTVSDVTWDDAGDITLTIGGQKIPFAAVRGLGQTAV